MSDFKDQRYLALHPDGKIYDMRLTMRDMGDQSAVLEAIGGQLPVELGPSFRLPNGSVVGIQRKNRNVYMYAKMEALKLNTVWRPYGSSPVKLMLVGVSTGETDFQASYLWHPPDDMKLWLVSVMTPTGPSGAYLPELTYIIAVGKKKFYRLPLPNLYEDCRICMGSWASKNIETWQDRFIEVYEQFWNAPWNTDLSDKHKPTESTAMFVFDSKGKQLPSPDGWEKLCRAANNAHFSDLPIV